MAPTNASVLILGESGTGKELVAQEIHRHSDRSSRAMVRVNCASVPRELYESEFFGHVKGAFTGAVQDRAGRFALANGGTLMLDEVGEIPLERQSKLLRVLQEGTYERIDDEKTREANVRLIAATNRDLKANVEAGKFRQDIFYRLNVFYQASSSRVAGRRGSKGINMPSPRPKSADVAVSAGAKADSTWPNETNRNHGRPVLASSV